MSTRILIADDHKIVRDGLKSLLGTLHGLTVVGEAEDGHQALRLARELKPDLVIMDVTMTGLNGVEATRQLTALHPGIKVIALSMHGDARYVVGMLKAGASAYLLKDCAFDELAQAVEAVKAGRTYLCSEVADVVVKGFIQALDGSPAPAQSALLSSREREVLQMLAEGSAARDISERLHISVKTVETHRRNLMQKLGLRSLPELTKFALREGLTTLGD